VAPGLVQEFIGQLCATTERLEDLGLFGGRLPPSPGALAPPGGFSAEQMTLIAGSIAAQRRSIEALKAQLSSYDEQLAEWSRTWADLEQRLLNMCPGPEAGR